MSDVTDDARDCIIRTVHGLPEGKVVTFGDISDKCYLHTDGGQAVGQVISKETSENPCGFPWWRVVFDKYEGLRPKNDEARRLLEGEGVRFRDNGSVDPDYRL